MELDEAIRHCEEVAEQNDTDAITYKNCKEIKNNLYEKLIAEKAESDCLQCAADHRQLAEWLTELKEAKRLLKLAVEDFAKLDRENAKNKNCMMSEMDCADCPLSWDSIDDRVEPCHSWRYTKEAEKLIES